MQLCEQQLAPEKKGAGPQVLHNSRGTQKRQNEESPAVKAAI
jgi:hypothetical protein